MKVRLRTLADRVEVVASDAHDLFAATAAVRLPPDCAFVRSGPGELLERGGEPLVLMGPRADGVILAAASLRRGAAAVSGEGAVLTLLSSGPCAEARLLEAGAFDASGKALAVELGPELPGSGAPPPWLALLVLAALVAHLLRRTGRITT